MYAALWRLIPGPAWVRIVVLTLLAIAVVAALFFVVFPAVSDLLVPQDVTVG